MAHLWTGAPAPPDWIELILCRDVYHCTPVELRSVPTSKILRHLTMLGVEAEVHKMRYG